MGTGIAIGKETVPPVVIPLVVEDRIVQGGIELAGKLVPLPVGPWRILGEAPTLRMRDGSTPPGPVTGFALVHLNGATVDGAVLVDASSGSATGGWGKPPACTRADLPYAKIQYESDHDGSCGYVVFVKAGPEFAGPEHPAWSIARRSAEARGWHLPSSWIMAGFRVSDPHDMVDVRYHFTPDAIVAADSRARATEAVVRWAAMAGEVVEWGFRNRRGDGEAALPMPAAALPGTPGDNTEPPGLWKHSLAYLREASRNLFGHLARRKGGFPGIGDEG
ncbi:MAG: hypothetical protein WCF85_07195 [Rhodospirillaceae bacterium]